MEQLARLGGRAALTGPKGTGKTTLMLELKRWAESAGWTVCYCRLSEEDGHFDSAVLKGLGSQSLVLLDGAEQLGFVSWALFRWRSRHIGQILISQHRERRWPTLMKTSADPERLALLLAELVGEAPSMQVCAELLASQDGNVRQLFHVLFCRAASLNSMDEWTWHGMSEHGEEG
jgi:hypothetical protein